VLQAPPNAPLQDSEQLAIRLDLAALRVRYTTAGTETALDTWIAQQGIELLDREGSTLELHYVTANPTPQVINNTTNVTQVVTKPVRTLVTGTGGFVDGKLPMVELWWHVDKSPEIDEERVKEITDAVVVVAEVDNAATPVQLPYEVRSVQHNVFQLVIDRGQWDDKGQQ
jgi:hypothetical protein